MAVERAFRVEAGTYIYRDWLVSRVVWRGRPLDEWDGRLCSPEGNDFVIEGSSKKSIMEAIDRIYETGRYGIAEGIEPTEANRENAVWRVRHFANVALVDGKLVRVT